MGVRSWAVGRSRAVGESCRFCVRRGPLLGAAPTGAIFVTTLPSGADVWLDGTYVGHAPVVVDALAVGAHHLTLTGRAGRPKILPSRSRPLRRKRPRSFLVRDGKRASLGYDRHPRPRPAGRGNDRWPAGRGGQRRRRRASAGTHERRDRGAAGQADANLTVYPLTRTDVVLGADTVVRSLVIAPADDYLPATAFHSRVPGSSCDTVATRSSRTSGRPATHRSATGVLRCAAHGDPQPHLSAAGITHDAHAPR